MDKISFFSFKGGKVMIGQNNEELSENSVFLSNIPYKDAQEFYTQLLELSNKTNIVVALNKKASIMEVRLDSAKATDITSIKPNILKFGKKFFSDLSYLINLNLL